MPPWPIRVMSSYRPSRDERRFEASPADTLGLYRNPAALLGNGL
jgi:hypothetical protein